MTDLFRFNNVNLDPYTETYHMGIVCLVMQRLLSMSRHLAGFYMQYLATWPEYFTVAEAPNSNIMAYGNFVYVSGFLFFHAFALVFGKAEGRGENWHGHVTAVTVAPEFRRLGLAQQLMHSLEEISET